ncbi:MAG TPA: 30S ribosomal protein S7 [candidate division Zixibacteria bacterium]|nr:30S ribosomal protein S7 [candidate division Zixibacteria bacterium]MDD4918422.1 30S ribosomal protein S7 [candidate division Zixibacteria bacterium]MDM7973236.1 30S ribosomal protein S7 [candidate division Zixibacteria bacterium]HOD67637.1 30S ribosomal protein S7 [candidate division Zixibacteria bacterium]HPM37235.1 30S ribosomal protein S7 [candidate division Zixibacteria bacterium]
MSRRTSAERRPVVPDFKYGEKTITQFISCLMKDGKRSTAQRLFYDAVGQAEKKSGESGLEVFRKALNNVKPVLEVRSRRVGGATYQVPVEVRPERRTALAIRWLISYARARGGHTMAEKLAAEFLAAANNEGAAIKKKEDTHKMAEANKAFAHFRW